jgi:hypothetical protein
MVVKGVMTHIIAPSPRLDHPVIIFNASRATSKLERMMKAIESTAE